MDSNNWRAAHAQPQPQPQPQAPVQVRIQGGEAAARTVAGMDTGDWRSQFLPDFRQRIVIKIMESLKKLIPFSGQDGLQELKQIAGRFEEKICIAASSQSDYLRKISAKMLTLDKSKNPTSNSLQTNTTSSSNNPTDSASGSMQSHVHNQGLPISNPMMANQSQARQQMLSHNIQNNMTSTGLPSSASLTSAMVTVGGLTQTTMTNVVGHNANLQNLQKVSNVAQNSMENSMGQGMPSNIFSNTQIQMQGRQQQAVPQQQQQQSQNPQHHLYQQQLQHQLMKQKLQQGNILQSLVQSHIQQQQQPQHSQAVRQQKQPQQSPVHQQQTSLVQQPKLATQQQQQQIVGQKPNVAKMQQQQPQQQRVMGQQSNISNLQKQQQQQLRGEQSNLSTVHQQHQVIDVQSSNSGMLDNQQNVNMIQQSKNPGQQLMQQAATTLLPTRGQQSQLQVQLPLQQLNSPIQSQPAQVPQQMGGLQQQPNTLQRDMQQRLQTSSQSLHHQNVIDQQKQLIQSQRPILEVPSTSLDSTAEAGSFQGGDWQEGAYQKIKSLKEMYFVELSELYQKIAARLQQYDSLPQQPKQIEKLKYFKGVLEKLLHFLRLNKNEIQIAHRDKIGPREKQIVDILKSNRPRRPVSSFQQGQLPLLNINAKQQSQQPQSQIPQMQPHENQMNAQMQSMNVQGPVTAMQQNNSSNLQHNPLSSASNISNSQQVARGPLQQNPVSRAQQMNVNQLASQSGVNTLQSNLNPLQPNSNMIQHPHLKQQEQQILWTQQLKQQYQQRQMQQQFLQRQQLMQQRQQLAKQQLSNQQQQPGQLAAHQMSQIHQLDDASDLKMSQQIGVEPGIMQQNHLAGQRSTYHHQQLKSGTPFLISSPQVLQAVSPQVPQHLSPQIDQPDLLTSLGKSGTPLQSSSSPLIAPSPSTPLAPSPMPMELEKVIPSVSSLFDSGNIGHQQAAVASAPAQSPAIGTPGISASPLLAEFTSADGTHGVASTIASGKSDSVEQPQERLLKAVKSMSSKALSAAVSDISSVVSMVDEIAGSAPGNGSRAAIGEDLVTMTKRRLHARNLFTPDSSPEPKKMRRYTSAIPSYVVSSASSVNDSFRQLNGYEASDLESTASSRCKRPRVEANNALLEEIREINQCLMDTVVDISNEDVDPTAEAGAAEGTIVNCSFSAVGLSPNLKSQYASARLSPIQPLRLLVPNNYPNCSPVLLDKFPVKVSKDYEDLSIKVKSRFSISLRNLPQPTSLVQIANTWDVCARAVICEYAQQSGGGSFSSKYGTWETFGCSMH